MTTFESQDEKRREIRRPNEKQIGFAWFTLDQRVELQQKPMSLEWMLLLCRANENTQDVATKWFEFWAIW